MNTVRTLPAPVSPQKRRDEDGVDLTRLLLSVKRRWRWVLWLAIVVPLLVMGVVERLPSQYTSKATLVLIQTQVPKQYVDQLTSGSSAEMINAVTREVLAVPRLAGIVESFGLFPELRAKMTAEQLGEELRKQIEVRPADQVSPRADYTAFTISFTDKDAKVAQTVLSQLSTIFVEVNLKDREEKAQTTTDFLRSQLEIAKKRLDEQERVLMNARVANASQNPTVNSAKLSLLADLRIQSQLNATNLSRLEQQQSAIQSSLTAALGRVENERAALLNTYTEQHPEVKKRTAEMDSIRRILGAGSEGTQEKDTPISDPVIADLAGQLQRGAREAEALEKQGKALRAEMDRYNRTILQSSPVSEQQLTLAEKDYELFRQEFADLQAKYFRSQVAANMEGELSGQNFRLVDPPTLPALPSSPKRLRISLLAILAGVVLGFAVAAGFEIVRPTYLTNREVAAAYPASVLINIPIMLTPKEEKREKLNTTAHVLLGCVGVVALSLWVYRMYLNDAR